VAYLHAAAAPQDLLLQGVGALPDVWRAVPIPGAEALRQMQRDLARMPP